AEEPVARQEAMDSSEVDQNQSVAVPVSRVENEVVASGTTSPSVIESDDRRSDGWVRYSVAPGDTLELIGRRWDLTADDMLENNEHLGRNVVEVGDHLWVPPGLP